MVIAFIMDYYLSNYYFKDWKNVSTYQKDFWNVTHKGGVYNVAIFGSSRAFHSVNPKVLGIKSKWMNFGSDGTSHGDHFLFLHQALENNEMDTIMLEVDEFTLSGYETNTDPFKEYVFALKVKESPFKETSKDYMDAVKNTIWKLPLTKFLEYNSFYSLGYGPSYDKNTFNESFGFEGLESDTFNKNFEGDSVVCSIHPIDIKYLENFISLANKMNKVTILFTAPVHPRFLEKEKNRNMSIFKIQEIAKKYNVDYFDYSTIFEQKQRYFADYTHLNRSGADKFTIIMRDRINGR